MTQLVYSSVAAVGKTYLFCSWTTPFERNTKLIGVHCSPFIEFKNSFLSECFSRLTRSGVKWTNERTNRFNKQTFNWIHPQTDLINFNLDFFVWCVWWRCRNKNVKFRRWEASSCRFSLFRLEYDCNSLRATSGSQRFWNNVSEYYCIVCVSNELYERCARHCVVTYLRGNRFQNAFDCFCMEDRHFWWCLWWR